MYDYLIIGGGLIGLLTARELSNAGARVSVIDRQQPGQESSWAAGGILSPLFPWEYSEAINQLNQRSQSLYRGLVESLIQQTAIDPELTHSGMLLTSPQNLKQASDWYTKHKVPFTQLDQDELSQQFPDIQALDKTGIYLDHIAHIRPPALIRALVQSLSQQGVQLFDHKAAKGFEFTNDLVSGVSLNKGEQIQAGQYVICAGAWTTALWPELYPTIDIQPVKGQIILYPDCGIQLNCMYMHDHRYLIQRQDGRILVGSSTEHSGFDNSTSSNVRDELIAFAESCCPTLRDIAIENHWSGLRPATPSGVPYIDKHPKFNNLSINSGHFRNGIVLAPASAEMLANRLLNHTQSVDPQAFSFAGHVAI